MSVRIIAGESGQGKTEKVMEEAVSRSITAPEFMYYMIVPEQFGLQMQRDMVKKHPNHGFSNIDVLSFFRLSCQIFDHCGYETNLLLEDLGTSMILKKLLTTHRDEFTFFKKSMDKKGFLDALKSMIMEMISYGIDGDSFDIPKEALSEYPALAHKCREIGRIYTLFLEEIRDNYMVMEQTLEVAASLIADSELVKKGVFYFDGFTGFTPLQLKFLSELIVYAKEVVFTVTIPYIPFGQKSGRELFHFSEQSMQAITGLCRSRKVTMETPELLDAKEPPRYEGQKELIHLQRNFARPDYETYEEKPEGIEVIICNNPEEEAEYILHKAEEFVRKDGIRYRDIAILTGNEEEYIPAFQRQAEKQNIPLFVDATRQMSYQPGAETVRALFYLARSNYSYESVFRYLKSGMSHMTDNEIDLLENYCIAAGIRGYSMWSRPFGRRFYGVDAALIEQLQELRMQVLRETERSYLILKDKNTTVKDKITVIYETLEELGVHRKNLEKAAAAKAAGNQEKSREYERFYPLLVDLFDKTVDIFGDEKLSAEELSDVLDAGLEALGITVAPVSMDRLLLGDLKRTRLPGIRVLFIAGMNDGQIPPVPDESGMINDDEKEILKPFGISLSLSAQEQVLENDFYMYLAFAKPKQKLLMTCSKVSGSGSSLRPSTLLHDMEKIFPKLTPKEYGREERRKYINWFDAEELLRKKLRNCETDPESVKKDPVFLTLFDYGLKNHPEEMKDLWKEKDRKMDFAPITTEQAVALYGTELYGSVTKMEQFAGCPFRFFCTYGLGLSEREEYKVRAMDLGNVFHSALEFFSKKVRQSDYSWKNIPEDQQNLWITQALDHAVGEQIREVFDSSARNRHHYVTVERIVRRTIHILKEHLKNSEFEPDRFEFRFGQNDHLDAATILLEEGRSLKMQGIIDRIDVCEKDDQIYMRIIDFKSGRQKFNLGRMYYGQQMQLVVYMNAAIEIYGKTSGKKVIPAGIYYYQMKDPIMQAEVPDANKQLKEFVMDGYTNDDPDILQATEDASPMVSVKIQRKKTGEPYKNSPVMETESFFAMGSHIRKRLKETGEQIYDGVIAAHPYKDDQGTSCDYCTFAEVCGFDAAKPEYAFKEYPKRSAEDIKEEFKAGS